MIAYVFQKYPENFAFNYLQFCSNLRGSEFSSYKIELKKSSYAKWRRKFL